MWLLFPLASKFSLLLQLFDDLICFFSSMWPQLLKPTYFIFFHFIKLAYNCYVMSIIFADNNSHIGSFIPMEHSMSSHIPKQQNILNRITLLPSGCFYYLLAFDKRHSIVAIGKN